MGLPLDTAEKWLAARRSDIDPAARAFIEASARADRAVARRWQWLQGAVSCIQPGPDGGTRAAVGRHGSMKPAGKYTGTHQRGHAASHGGAGRVQVGHAPKVGDDD